MATIRCYPEDVEANKINLKLNDDGVKSKPSAVQAATKSDN